MTAPESNPSQDKKPPDSRTESETVSAGYAVDTVDNQATLGVNAINDEGNDAVAELELSTVFGLVDVALDKDEARNVALELLDCVRAHDEEEQR